MEARMRIALLAAVLLAAFVFLAYYTIERYSSGLPSMEQHNSPVNIGADEGRLENSANVGDSVLVACKRDAFGSTIYSKGRRAVGTHIYSVSDSSDNGRCNRNATGTRLNQHWLTEGSLMSQVSNH